MGADGGVLINDCSDWVSIIPVTGKLSSALFQTIVLLESSSALYILWSNGSYRAIQAR